MQAAKLCMFIFKYVVRPFYKKHSREPENVVLISSCPLYTGYNYMYNALMETNKTVVYRDV